jgi:hypothetical protein
MPKSLLRACFLVIPFAGLQAGCGDDVKPLKVEPIKLEEPVAPENLPPQSRPGPGSSANFQKYGKSAPTSGKSN